MKLGIFCDFRPKFVKPWSTEGLDTIDLNNTESILGIVNPDLYSTDFVEKKTEEFASMGVKLSPMVFMTPGKGSECARSLNKFGHLTKSIRVYINVEDPCFIDGYDPNRDVINFFRFIDPRLEVYLVTHSEPLPKNEKYLLPWIRICDGVVPMAYSFWKDRPYHWSHLPTRRPGIVVERAFKFWSNFFNTNNIEMGLAAYDLDFPETKHGSSVTATENILMNISTCHMLGITKVFLWSSKNLDKLLKEKNNKKVIDTIKYHFGVNNGKSVRR